jgi:anti-anti-sigma factor
MTLIVRDPATGRIAIQDNWAINNGQEIAKAIDAQLSTLTGNELVLDFAKVKFIDSSGISDLIQINMKIRPKGKRIVIENAGPEVRKIFSICKIERLVTLKD